MGKDKQKNENLDEGNEDATKTKGRLTNDTISYYKRVDSVLTENNFESDELYQAFIRNVFTQLQEDSVQVLRHTLTSKVIEKIIPLLSKSQYIELLEFVKEDVKLLCCDRFASHVMETIVISFNEISDATIDNTLIKQFVSFCKAIRQLVDHLIRDVFGCHVVSKILQTLSGVKVSDGITKSKASMNSKKKTQEKYRVKERELSAKEVTIVNVADSLKKQYSKHVKALLNVDNFGELLCHRNASPVLQVLLITTSHINKKKYSILSNQILQRARLIENRSLMEDENEDTIHKLPVVLTDAVGSHLIEVLLQTADSGLYRLLSSQCFRNIIISLCIQPVANFLAQTFLRLLEEEDQALFYVDKLFTYMEDILAVGHMGCISRLVELIARLELIDKQKKFIKAVSSALHIPDDTDKKPNVLVTLIITMTTFDMFYKKESEKDSKTEKDSDTKKENENSENENPCIKKNSINYHGACILKNCFKFKKCKTIVQSFLALSPIELVTIACDPYGSFIFESFYESQSISLQSKSKMSKNLLNHTYTLSSDKFGSRVVDAIWKVSSEETLAGIRAKLIEHKFQLKSNLYGRIILTNCGINQLPSNVIEKKEKQEKKRKMFEEIIASADDEVKKAKKEKKPKNDDRVVKYMEQLKQLGISFETN